MMWLAFSTAVSLKNSASSFTANALAGAFDPSAHAVATPGATRQPISRAGSQARRMRCNMVVGSIKQGGSPRPLVDRFAPLYYPLPPAVWKGARGPADRASYRIREGAFSIA